MSSCQTPRWKRLLHEATPFLFNKCPAGNMHWIWDRLCFCCTNEYDACTHKQWHGGILDLKTGREYQECEECQIAQDKELADQGDIGAAYRISGKHGVVDYAINNGEIPNKRIGFIHVPQYLADEMALARKEGRSVEIQPFFETLSHDVPKLLNIRIKIESQFDQNYLCQPYPPPMACPYCRYGRLERDSKGRGVRCVGRPQDPKNCGWESWRRLNRKPTGVKANPQFARDVFFS